MIARLIGPAAVALAAGTLASGCGESREAAGGTSATPNPTVEAPQATPAAPGSAANAFIGSIAVDPDDGTMFLGTGLGLFRVPPGGKKATRVVGELRTPQGAGPVSSNLVVRFASDDQLLASGHPEGGGSALPENVGLIRSTDGGKTWGSVSELGRADFHILQVDGDRMMAVRVEQEEIEVSADGGRTFTARTPPAVPVDAAFDPADPRRIVVTTEQGVFVSSDEGRSWRQRDNLPSEQLAWFAADKLYRADPGGLVKASRDGGATWEDRGSVGLSINELAVDAAGRLYASVPGGEVRRSSDGGSTWKSLVVLK